MGHVRSLDSHPHGEADNYLRYLWIRTYSYTIPPHLRGWCNATYSTVTCILRDSYFTSVAENTKHVVF